MKYKEKINQILSMFLLSTGSNVKTDFEKGKISESDLFSWICVETYFYNGYLKLEEFIDINVDGNKDGGVDLILEENKIVQAKEQSLKATEIIEAFSKAKKVCDVLKNNKTNNPNGKGDLDLKVVENYHSKINKDEKIDIYVFAWEPYANFDDSTLKKWVIDNNNADYNYHYIFSQEILTLLKNQTDDFSNLNEFNFKINNNNVLINSNNNLNKLKGIIINVSIYEIFKMLDTNEKNLFSQNVREFIKGTNSNTKSGSVNNGIQKTLETYPDILWFANNGIVILTNSLSIKFDVIKIENFSVINGSQTVTNIFNFINSIKKENLVNYLNIPIVCKIIEKPKNVNNDNLLVFGNLEQLEEDFGKFIIRSTNNQKPILSWTFFFDEEDVKLVQELLKGKSIFLKIKDGALNKEILEKFTNEQIIKLPDFAQISKSVLNLSPGKAMQRKNKLFLEDAEYKYSFKIIVENNSYVELPIKAIEFLNLIKQDSLFINSLKTINKGKQWIMAYFSIKMMDITSFELLKKEFNKEDNLVEINKLDIKWNLQKNINISDTNIRNEIISLINFIESSDLSTLYKDEEFFNWVIKNLLN